MFFSWMQADGKTTAVEVKAEPMDETDGTENAAAWGVLRDDFMIGAKMKDWDKQQTDGVADENTPLDRHSDDSSVDDDTDSDDGDYS